MNKVAYRVLSRRTRVIEESFDVYSDDFHVCKPIYSTTVTFILEGYGPVVIKEVGYDTLFGPMDTAWDAEVNANRDPQTLTIPLPIPQIPHRKFNLNHKLKEDILKELFTLLDT